MITTELEIVSSRELLDLYEFFCNFTNYYAKILPATPSGGSSRLTKIKKEKKKSRVLNVERDGGARYEDAEDRESRSKWIQKIAFQ